MGRGQLEPAGVQREGSVLALRARTGNVLGALSARACTLHAARAGGQKVVHVVLQKLRVEAVAASVRVMVVSLLGRGGG